VAGKTCLHSHPAGLHVGRLADHDTANDCGTHISYRVPKSALSALSISVAIELRVAQKNIAVLCVDPGDVPTKLSRWTGEIDLNESVHGMFAQIEKATIADTGLFVNWAGHKWSY
jgi:NAD(P)-dependent dehydrogenase (short-subunit alcohol dehydrogenase family)